MATKYRVGVIGSTGRGNYGHGLDTVWREFSNTEVTAVADDNADGLAKAVKRLGNPRGYADYRKMLEKEKSIDAVSVSTPDHMHAVAAITAMKMGKHVYVQKPLTQSVYEARVMRRVAKEQKVATQMGNQGHTFTGMRRIKEWVDAGVVGDVREVITWTNRPNPPWFVPPSSFPPVTGPAPSTLDWDLWQGPVKSQDYSADYVPVKWRGWWKYGCGALGDIGCHTFDAPFWALGLGSPTKVEIERKDPPGKGFIPMGSVVTYHFAARGKKPPVTLKWYEKGYEVPKPTRWQKDKDLPSGGGMYMEGTKETLYHSGMRPNSPMVTPGERFMEMKSELVKIPKLPSVGNGPIEEWYRAIKGDGPMPGSNFDYAVPLTEMVLLGALAQRTGKNIEWDSEKMKVKGQPEFDALIKEPARKGWQYGESLG